MNTALYSVANAAPPHVDATATPAALTFEYQDAAGLHVRKQFRLEPNSYVVGFSATVMDGDRAVNPAIQWGPGLGDIVALGRGGRNVRRAEGIYDIAGKVKRPAAARSTTTPRTKANFEFAGVDTHYFISMAVKPGNAQVDYHPLSLPVPGSNPPISRDYIGYDITFAAPPSSARFFFGPKHFETLKAVDPQMVPAIWFGMFSFFSVPLLSALNWIHGFIGNYGWSILALTLLINLVMFPLRHKSFVSMRKMQEIQPQVKMIQDRYAKLKMSDPARQKMNTELMDLYRSKGVNPASGCIPMLLTIPVLLAFYGLLSESIELRGAPFMLWIKDLSVADPYYVTPILMGLSQLAQQRMAPAAADPCAAEDDDVHAHRLHVPVHHVTERPGAVLAGEQRAADRPAGADEPSDRPAGHQRAAPAGRAPAQESRGREDRSGDGRGDMTIEQQAADFVSQVVKQMGLGLEARVGDQRRRHAHQSRRRRRRNAARPARRRPPGAAAHRRQRVSPPARRAEAPAHRLHGLPPRQRQRAEADGEVPRRKGEDRPAWNRASGR